jgi:hypothetical protein
MAHPRATRRRPSIVNMTVRRADWNNRAKHFVVQVENRTYRFPYAKAEPEPTADDPVRDLYIDPEIARQGFVFTLESGREGTVHAGQVLEYNQDPDYMRDWLLYNLTCKAQDMLAESRLSKREIIRRLGTSASQFYRLIDQTNYRKSIDQVLALLHVLDCDVEFIVRKKSA